MPELLPTRRVRFHRVLAWLLPGTGLVACCSLVAAAVGVSAHGAAAAPTPAERAKEVQAQRVLADVQALDVRMEHVVQEWDGARLELATVKRRLAANRMALKRARAGELRTRRRLADVLVRVYKNGQPSTVAILLGANSFSEALDGLQFAHAVAREDRRVAVAARAAVRRYDLQRQSLARARARQRATVARLASAHAKIAAGLAARQRMLASIRTQIAQLQARERARERRLAAEARARIMREQQRLAAERAVAARAQVNAPAPTEEPPPAPAIASVPGVTSATSTTPGTPAQPAPATGVEPPPHPEAAAIAARYLGVPYVWGGASPAGFDCSGLVTYVYAQLGISLPHYTVAQWNATTPIPAADMQPGDLVFFDGLGHVGIYIGGGQFIHAPHTGDVVRVSSLSGSYGRGFVGARRV